MCDDKGRPACSGRCKDCSQGQPGNKPTASDLLRESLGEADAGAVIRGPAQLMKRLSADGWTATRTKGSGA